MGWTGGYLKRHAYVYRYDDLGNLTNALYASDKPSTPGEFNESKNYFNEEIGYDLGGNIKRMKRNRETNPVNYPNPSTMDDLHFTYQNNGYLPIKIDDSGEKTHTPQRKHFIDNANVENEYIYDKTGRLIADKNREITISYNFMGLPRFINHQPSMYYIKYIYDAAGNKLQKKYMKDIISVPNPYTQIMETDYIGNFIYEQGELAMIYHPEGMLRPKPESADNETEFVYDYFIKDYLGNVRVVLTEEDATYSDKFLATMEEVHRQIERDNFDNIDETAQDLPLGYPVNGSVELNEKIASLSAANGTQIGPSMVLPVRRGDKVSLRTEYFYSEDAPGATYDNVNMFINEILLALAASGSGILRLTEGQLIDLAVGDPRYTEALIPFFSSNFDTTDVSKPHAYLVWMLYDNDMKLIVEGSGAKRVTDPNALRELLQEDIPVIENGYLHAYVSNGGIEATSFDNFLVTYMRGKTRQINHYYPYGLSIAGLGGDYDEYLNKYTSKELQTGEFDPAISTGLEMFDFGSRFYDPQIGRWHTPDPAEQFANPYLAMGNNPVMYVDPDGEWVFLIPHISFGNGSFDLGLTVGFGFYGGASVQATVGHTFYKEGNDNTYATVGGSLAGFTASVGYGTQTGYTAGVGFGFGPPGVNSNMFSAGVSWSQNHGTSIHAFGASMGENGFGFSPTMGFSYSYIPGNSGRQVPALYACDDCPFEMQYLNEYEVIEYRDPYLGPFKHNGFSNEVNRSQAENLKTGLTAFEASNAAKMHLLNYAGGAKAVPGWYMTGMTRIGQVGALTNMGLSAYMYDQGQISGAKLTYDTVWSGVGTMPNPYVQLIYWAGVAGQYFGPSSWGLDVWGRNPKPLYDNSRLKP